MRCRSKRSKSASPDCDTEMNFVGMNDKYIFTDNQGIVHNKDIKSYNIFKKKYELHDEQELG